MEEMNEIDSISFLERLRLVRKKETIDSLQNEPKIPNTFQRPKRKIIRPKAFDEYWHSQTLAVAKNDEIHPTSKKGRKPKKFAGNFWYLNKSTIDSKSFINFNTGKQFDRTSIFKPSCKFKYCLGKGKCQCRKIKIYSKDTEKISNQFIQNNSPDRSKDKYNIPENIGLGIKNDLIPSIQSSINSGSLSICKIEKSVKNNVKDRVVIEEIDGVILYTFETENDLNEYSEIDNKKTLLDFSPKSVNKKVTNDETKIPVVNLSVTVVPNVNYKINNGDAECERPLSELWTNYVAKNRNFDAEKDTDNFGNTNNIGEILSKFKDISYEVKIRTPSMTSSKNVEANKSKDELLLSPLSSKRNLLTFFEKLKTNEKEDKCLLENENQSLNNSELKIQNKTMTSPSLKKHSKSKSKPDPEYKEDPYYTDLKKLNELSRSRERYKCSKMILHLGVGRPLFPVLYQNTLLVKSQFCSPEEIDNSGDSTLITDFWANFAVSTLVTNPEDVKKTTKMSVPILHPVLTEHLIHDFKSKKLFLPLDKCSGNFEEQLISSTNQKSTNNNNSISIKHSTPGIDSINSKGIINNRQILSPMAMATSELIIMENTEVIQSNDEDSIPQEIHDTLRCSKTFNQKENCVRVAGQEINYMARNCSDVYKYKLNIILEKFKNMEMFKNSYYIRIINEEEDDDDDFPIIIDIESISDLQEQSSATMGTDFYYFNPENMFKKYDLKNLISYQKNFEKMMIDNLKTGVYNRIVKITEAFDYALESMRWIVMLVENKFTSIICGKKEALFYNEIVEILYRSELTRSVYCYKMDSFKSRFCKTNGIQFGAYAFPGLSELILLGPYDLDEKHNLMGLKEAKGKRFNIVLTNTEEEPFFRDDLFNMWSVRNRRQIGYQWWEPFNDKAECANEFYLNSFFKKISQFDFDLTFRKFSSSLQPDYSKMSFQCNVNLNDSRKQDTSEKTSKIKINPKTKFENATPEFKQRVSKKKKELLNPFLLCDPKELLNQFSSNRMKVDFKVELDESKNSKPEIISNKEINQVKTDKSKNSKPEIVLNTEKNQVKPDKSKNSKPEIFLNTEKNQVKSDKLETSKPEIVSNTEKNNQISTNDQETTSKSSPIKNNESKIRKKKKSKFKKPLFQKTKKHLNEMFRNLRKKKLEEHLNPFIIKENENNKICQEDEKLLNQEFCNEIGETCVDETKCETVVESNSNSKNDVQISEQKNESENIAKNVETITISESPDDTNLEVQNSVEDDSKSIDSEEERIKLMPTIIKSLRIKRRALLHEKDLQLINSCHLRHKYFGLTNKVRKNSKLYNDVKEMCKLMKSLKPLREYELSSSDEESINEILNEIEICKKLPKTFKQSEMPNELPKIDQNPKTEVDENSTPAGTKHLDGKLQNGWKSESDDSKSTSSQVSITNEEKNLGYKADLEKSENLIDKSNADFENEIVHIAKKRKIDKNEIGNNVVSVTEKNNVNIEELSNDQFNDFDIIDSAVHDYFKSRMKKNKKFRKRKRPTIFTKPNYDLNNFDNNKIDLSKNIDCNEKEKETNTEEVSLSIKTENTNLKPRRKRKTRNYIRKELNDFPIGAQSNEKLFNGSNDDILITFNNIRANDSEKQLLLENQKVNNNKSENCDIDNTVSDLKHDLIFDRKRRRRNNNKYEKDYVVPKKFNKSFISLTDLAKHNSGNLIISSNSRFSDPKNVIKPKKKKSVQLVNLADSTDEKMHINGGINVPTNNTLLPEFEKTKLIDLIDLVSQTKDENNSRNNSPFSESLEQPVVNNLEAKIDDSKKNLQNNAGIHVKWKTRDSNRKFKNWKKSLKIKKDEYSNILDSLEKRDSYVETIKRQEIENGSEIDMTTAAYEILDEGGNKINSNLVNSRKKRSLHREHNYCITSKKIVKWFANGKSKEKLIDSYNRSNKINTDDISAAPEEPSMDHSYILPPPSKLIEILTEKSSENLQNSSDFITTVEEPYYYTEIVDSTSLPDYSENNNYRLVLKSLEKFDVFNKSSTERDEIIYGTGFEDDLDTENFERNFKEFPSPIGVDSSSPDEYKSPIYRRRPQLLPKECDCSTNECVSNKFQNFRASIFSDSNYMLQFLESNSAENNAEILNDVEIIRKAIRDSKMNSKTFKDVQQISEPVVKSSNNNNNNSQFYSLLNIPENQSIRIVNELLLKESICNEIDKSVDEIFPGCDSVLQSDSDSSIESAEIINVSDVEVEEMMEITSSSTEESKNLIEVVNDKSEMNSQSKIEISSKIESNPPVSDLVNKLKLSEPEIINVPPDFENEKLVEVTEKLITEDNNLEPKKLNSIGSEESPTSKLRLFYNKINS